MAKSTAEYANCDFMVTILRFRGKGDSRTDWEPLLCSDKLTACHALYLLSNLSLISSWQKIQVWPERTRVHHRHVTLLIQIRAEQDVVLQSGVLNPGLLRHICYRPLRENKRRVTNGPEST